MWLQRRLRPKSTGLRSSQGLSTPWCSTCCRSSTTFFRVGWIILLACAQLWSTGHNKYVTADNKGRDVLKRIKVECLQLSLDGFFRRCDCQAQKTNSKAFYLMLQRFRLMDFGVDDADEAFDALRFEALDVRPARTTHKPR